MNHIHWHSILPLALAAALLVGCQAVAPVAPATQAPVTTPAPAADDHSAHMQHVQQSGAPFDAAFMDSMIEHHQGAIDMANEVLANSQRPELRTLAEAILATQAQEIEQMRAWRDAWYPELAPSDGMGMAMGDMAIHSDASIPFDQRFLTTMISHHQGAVEMAEMALVQAEHQELKDLAEAIITAQTAEIEQMQRWQQAWK